MMNRRLKLAIAQAGILSVVGCASIVANAQMATMATQVKTGERLFNQSCRICHAENLPGAAPYGGLLWSGSGGGSVTAINAIISEGTARMPAWKYRFSQQEIGMISAYLLTIRTKPQLSKGSSLGAFESDK
jgi:mono/diheme cytochrome c family protein